MKTIWNFLKSRFLWVNILIAVILVFVISYLVLWSLDLYTHHGESVEVPDLSGLYVEEAELILRDSGLGYEVVDSVYLRSLKGGEIAEQTPSAGTLVKKSRKVYITINKLNKRLVTIPDLIGESKRKAQTNLSSIGFDADKVIYRPYEYNDAVLELQYQGEKINAGDKAPDGAQIVLIVGRNDKSVEVVVPSLIGLNISEAKEKIAKHRLAIGLELYDITPIDSIDALSYRVYDQTPDAGVVVSGGKTIELKLSKNEQNSDEEFF